jgi:hypothetical protein
MERFRQIYANMRLAHEATVLNFDPLTVLNPGPGAWWQTIANSHLNEGSPPDRRLFAPELIYCYWLEEGGLVQGMEVIARRFQNRRVGAGDPLARFDISPLRQVADLLWGFIDDESRRLGLQRRALEYLHEYGLRMVGKAVNVEPADNRGSFLQAFHSLLNTCVRFYRQVDDLTVNQNAAPVLASLKELQLILSQGESNQFGTVPLQARVEMLIIQELLSAPEIGRFLGGPLMARYPAPWMDRVDNLRRLMRWGSTSIVEFWNLAFNGQQILMTARFGDFGPAQNNPAVADTWARSLRNEIEQYVHSYRAVCGPDLGADLSSGQSIDATHPSVYLQQREAQFKRAG